MSRCSQRWRQLKQDPKALLHRWPCLCGHSGSALGHDSHCSLSAASRTHANPGHTTTVPDNKLTLLPGVFSYQSVVLANAPPCLWLYAERDTACDERDTAYGARDTAYGERDLAYGLPTWHPVKTLLPADMLPQDLLCALLTRLESSSLKP